MPLSHASAVAKLDAGSRFRTRRSGRAHDPGNGRNAGQRFAAEPQGGNRVQILNRGKLARGVVAEGQVQFIGRNAAAVVGNADLGNSAFADGDDDTGRAGVQRVFHQLLDHRCRAFDDLAGRDLGGDVRGKLLDGHSQSVADEADG